MVFHMEDPYMASEIDIYWGQKTKLWLQVRNRYEDLEDTSTLETH